MSATDEVAVSPNMQMIQLLTGFEVSQALYVVAKLDIATILSSGPQSLDQLAAATGANAEALGRIIRFLAGIGVFRTENGQVEITELGLTLADDRPESIRYGALYFMETHYGPFGELLHTALTGEPAATHHYGQPFFDWISADPERVDVQNRAFANITTGMRAGVFDGYRLPAGTAVAADIGGADGSMLVQLLADSPDCDGIVFDRPEVVVAAEENVIEHGLAERVRCVAGDFFESVPAADVYLLSYILHDWDDTSCLRILRTIGKAAEPGAKLVLVEAIIPPGDTPHPSKGIDLTMLALVSGRERTADEYRKLLDTAGFTLDRVVPSSTSFSIIEATLR
jgi:predicted transcriptional regulator